MLHRFRVAHVITRLDLGGAQQNTLFCTRHHDRNHFEVHLLAGRGGLLDDEARGIADAHVGLLDTLRHPVAPVWDPAAVVRLAREFRSRGIDLVHTHSSKAGILGRAAAALAGVPVVVHTVHGWSFNETQPPARRRAYVALERWAARRTDRMIVVSARNRDEGLSLGIGRREQYQVIRSGIEIDDFVRPATPRESMRRALGYGPEHKVVGTIACLKPQKAPLDFVRAAVRAAAADERLRFFIAGDGELRDEVEQQVRAAGLEDRVRLLGWRRDVVDLLHAMDVFVLTSLFEGLPRAALQAMAAGVPVVATAVDGTPEVVRDGETGLLVPPAEPDLAAAGVLRLIREPALAERCVRNARRVLTREFDIHEMVRELDRTYLDLLAAPRARAAL